MSMDKSFWEEPDYGEVIGIEPRNEVLTVQFANGDEIEVPFESLGADTRTTFHLDEDGALLAVGPSGEREIDWMALRARSDPAFAAELRERDADESRRIGRRLRVLRQNQNLSQKAAAEMAGMSAPQLAKIEKGESDLRVSTLRSVLRALGASFADIAGPDAPEVSIPELVKHGVKSNAPKEVLERIAGKVDPRRVAEVLARGFAWEPAALMQGAPKNRALDFAVAFKAGSPEKERRSPLLRLARTISEISEAAFDGPSAELPERPETIRAEISEPITLSSLTEWAWTAGIIVIPMSGPGFSAAAWYVGDRPVVVLKAKKDYVAHWLFLLAHELGHVVLGHAAGGAVVDVAQPRPLVATADSEEEEANDFALRLLIPDHEQLLTEIRTGSGQTLDEQKWNFKGEVERVAAERNLAPGLLGFVAAYGLPNIARDNDRWGSATNLAKEEEAARELVREAFSGRIDAKDLPELDGALLEAVVLE
jgi:transcriptional regulator with XRE-family HTH domain